MPPYFATLLRATLPSATLPRSLHMKRHIEKVVILGAGTMGARIAAHFANAGLPCSLLDIVPSDLTPDERARGLTLSDPRVRNRIVSAGFEAALKSRPPAFFSSAPGPPIPQSPARANARLQRHFGGTHFFNPPRYMKLVELIPGPASVPEVLDAH